MNKEVLKMSYELVVDLVNCVNVIITVLLMALLIVRDKQNLTYLEVFGNILCDIVAFILIIIISMKIHTNIKKWYLTKIDNL